MKDFVEKYVSTRRKRLTARVLRKMEKMNGFHQPKNLLPLARTFFKTGFRLISIIVSTNRKKAPKSVSLRRKRLLFKNLISRTFHKQEECYFLKIEIFLISVMVSTSRNKSFKILFCLAKISFFYSEFFASLVETIIEAMWDPIFLKKLHYS